MSVYSLKMPSKDYQHQSVNSYVLLEMICYVLFKKREQKESSI